MFARWGSRVTLAVAGGFGHPARPMEPAPTVTAVIRRSPEDFVVDEIPAYTPSGRGEHLFITFRKRGLTTPDALRALSRALDVDPRAAGAAGMKDRHAVTTQTASFPVPMARDAAAVVAGISIPGIEILGAARHDNKLKPGHLIGNRFTLVLRDIDAAEVQALCERLVEIGSIGVPNAFGPQRFGRDGDNPARAIAWLSGRDRGPRDKRDQRLLFSALQSLLFNQVLARREEAGTWAAVLPGDVAKKHDTGGLFTVPLEGPELDDAKARAAAGSLSATGPMFGAKMRWPEGEPAAIEREVLEASAIDPARFEAWKHLGEGTRRALRLTVAEMDVQATEEGAGKASVIVRFVLPKGGYATTVLGRACRLIDASMERGPRGSEASDGTYPVDGASDDVQEP
ncbi:tRNA pseudouridine 13 synthase [Minicystis rosea]|nr:tRNA pseudouridine 13 synthase [Minicystis rosea]